MAKVLLLTLYEPDYIGTRLLAAYLLRQGHEAHILHFKLPKRAKVPDYVEHHHGYQACTTGWIVLSRQDTNPITAKEYALLAQAITEYKPDIVGISARSLHDHLMPTLVPVIKKAAPASIIVAGGYGPTLNVEYYLRHGVHAVIRGEGEEALDELADAVEKGNDWREILNISAVDASKVFHNLLRPQRKNIDTDTAPLYSDEHCSWIENSQLHAKEDYYLRSNIYITLIGRGCIGRCTYCCGGQWYEQYKSSGHVIFRRRNRSKQSVLAELNNIPKSTKYITFNDELFAAPQEYILSFFEEYKKTVDKPFFIYLAYDKMLQNSKLFDTVLDAGWHSTGIGLQSGSESLCHDLYGRKNKNDDYVAYAEKLFENNVLTEIHIIGGNCYETEEDFEQTLQIISRLPFSITDPQKNKLINLRLKPHPQTPLLKLAPRVLSHPMSARLWLYRAALCECRRIMGDDAFTEMRSLRFYQKQPDVLLAQYRYLLEKMQREYFTKLAQGQEGKPIIFYGCGDIYQRNRHIFSGCKPSAILLDDEYINGRHKLDGLPLLPVEKITELEDSTPVIIFSNMATMLQRKLERSFAIGKNRIHTCTTPIQAARRPSTELSV